MNYIMVSRNLQYFKKKKPSYHLPFELLINECFHVSNKKRIYINNINKQKKHKKYIGNIRNTGNNSPQIEI